MVDQELILGVIALFFILIWLVACVLCLLVVGVAGVFVAVIRLVAFGVRVLL